MIVCGLDHFKAVNDSHGHAVGDAVLRDIAYELRKQLRTFELIYRIGGEEFLVLLPVAPRGVAAEAAERLCQAIRGRRLQGIAPTLSVGVATASAPAITHQEVFEAADAAPYSAKSSGRDRVELDVSHQPPDAGGLAPRRAMAPADASAV